EIQRDMAERNAGVPRDRRIDFRIGINVGDIIIEGDDIYGDGVNVAARLESLAEPGGICISSSVREQGLNKVPFIFSDLGEQTVKNIERRSAFTTSCWRARHPRRRRRSPSRSQRR